MKTEEKVIIRIVIIDAENPQTSEWGVSMEFGDKLIRRKAATREAAYQGISTMMKRLMVRWTDLDNLES